MKTYKKLIVGTLMMVIVSVGSVSVSYAQSDGFSVARRFGVGILSNFLNFGIGPSAEFWLTENLGIMASVGAGADLFNISGRGQFMLNNPMYIGKAAMKPYVGIGYTSVQGPEDDYYGIKTETDGNGVEAFAGLLFNIHKNIFLRGELGYSTVELTAKASTTVYGETIEAEASADYSAFTINLGIAYLF